MTFLPESFEEEWDIPKACKREEIINWIQRWLQFSSLFPDKSRNNIPLFTDIDYFIDPAINWGKVFESIDIERRFEIIECFKSPLDNYFKNSLKRLDGVQKQQFFTGLFSILNSMDTDTNYCLTDDRSQFVNDLLKRGDHPETITYNLSQAPSLIKEFHNPHDKSLVFYLIVLIPDLLTNPPFEKQYNIASFMIDDVLDHGFPLAKVIKAIITLPPKSRLPFISELSERFGTVFRTAETIEERHLKFELIFLKYFKKPFPDTILPQNRTIGTLYTLQPKKLNRVIDHVFKSPTPNSDVLIKEISKSLEKMTV